MKHFGGFPVKMRFTTVPDIFFSHVMPDIEDIAELKTTLIVLQLLYKKRGYPRFTTLWELASHAGLGKTPDQEGKTFEENLKSTLQKAVDRGTILHLALVTESGEQDLYFLNTDADRQVMTKLMNGEIALPGLEKAVPKQELAAGELPDAFTLYEDNIGMITPMIAEEIREAQKRFPEMWLRDAIKEAANQNKRKWSYIAAILERWSAEGRSDGTYRRDTKKTDPDKFIKGKYGHMVQR
jgi:DNA replication protein